MRLFWPSRQKSSAQIPCMEQGVIALDRRPLECGLLAQEKFDQGK